MSFYIRGLAAFALCALSGGAAYASGYGLKEQSAAETGVAYAGSAATTSHAGDIAYNPASLSGVADFDLSISAAGILPGSRANYATALTAAGTPTGGSAKPSGYISDAVVPGFAFRQRLSDRWTIGLDVSAPWGLRTFYPKDWAGRYYALKTQLLTVNAMPAVAYEVSPWLTLGAGAQIEYAKGSLTSAIDFGTLGALNAIPGAVPGASDGYASLNGDDWSAGYTLGALAHVMPGVTLGVSYRSPIHHRLSGNLKFALDDAGIGATLGTLTGAFADTKAHADITMPRMVLMGARVDLSQCWTALAEADWTNWSSFHNLAIIPANPAQPADMLNGHWHDSWFGAVGVEYHPTDEWKLRFGTAYDASPVPDGTRDPRIPDASRIWLAVGFEYHATDAITIDLSGAHLFALSGKMNLSAADPANALRGYLAGKSDSYVNIIGVQVNYRTL